MNLIDTRAAFEKAVTDTVLAANNTIDFNFHLLIDDYADIDGTLSSGTEDNTVSITYDNVSFVTPGKTKKYVVMSLNFVQSTLQNQGAASDYYAGVIQCNVYVPKNKGTSALSVISKYIIDGLTSVNASNYSDVFNVKPRVVDINGPTMLEIEDRSHFVGVISCQFSANA